MSPTQISTSLSLPLIPGSLGERFPNLIQCQFALFSDSFKEPPHFPSLLHNLKGQTPLWLANSDLDMVNTRNLPPSFYWPIIVKAIRLLGFCTGEFQESMGGSARETPWPLFLPH